MTVDTHYKKWVVELKAKIRSAQVKAAVAVNLELLELSVRSRRRLTGATG